MRYFVFPPAARVLTWFGQGLVMVIDGQDLALAVRGYDGRCVFCGSIVGPRIGRQLLGWSVLACR